MLLVVLFGVLVGCLAGLIPGLHSNLISVLVAGFSFDVLSSVVFITAMSVSRSVVDAVPTVFLGFSDDVLGLFPGHRLLKKGKGIVAVKCCVLGSVLGVVVAICLVPAYVFLFPIFFGFLKPFLFWFLLAFVVFLLSRDLWWSVLIFVLSGLLGFLALNSLRNPLFPLLSGLFGVSGIVLSFGKNSIPVQSSRDGKVNWFVPLLSGVFAGSFVSLFPGLRWAVRR